MRSRQFKILISAAALVALAMLAVYAEQLYERSEEENRAANAAAEAKARAIRAQEKLESECVARGGSWGKHGSYADYCYFEAEKEQCVAQEGDWRMFGLPARYRCLLTAKDAGKPCTGKADCTYECEYGPKGRTGPLPGEPTEGVTGECQSQNYSYGCGGIVEGGRVTYRCRD